MKSKPMNGRVRFAPPPRGLRARKTRRVPAPARRDFWTPVRRLSGRTRVLAAGIVCAAGACLLPAPWAAGAVGALGLALVPALFLRCRRPGRHPGWRFTPPEDDTLALVRGVAIDGAMVLTGTRTVRRVACPARIEGALHLRAGSGALLLATAATLTAGTCPDGEAILSSMATLGFTPERLARRCPALGTARLRDVEGILCRDGAGERAYFLAEPAALLACCARVWEGGEHGLTQDARADLLSSARDLAQGGRTVYALAMAASRDGRPEEGVFLGMLTLGDVTAEGATEALEMLRGAGLTVAPRAGSGLTAETAGVLGLDARPGVPAVLVAPEADAAYPWSLTPDEHARADWAGVLVRAVKRAGDTRARLAAGLAQTLTVALTAVAAALPGWLAAVCLGAVFAGLAADGGERKPGLRFSHAWIRAGLALGACVAVGAWGPAAERLFAVALAAFGAALPCRGAKTGRILIRLGCALALCAGAWAVFTPGPGAGALAVSGGLAAAGLLSLVGRQAAAERRPGGA